METILKCQGLCKDWGDIQALRDVTLEVPQGAVLAVVGPNGAGKSTWLQLIAGLVPATDGEAWVAGVSIRENPRQAHEHIGYLPDFYGISARLKVHDYLQYFALSYRLEPEIIPTRISEIMKNLDLVELGNRYVRQLSRGQKQRVAIGRALINNPKLLLLDEPVAGLDPKARIEFNGLVSRLAGQGMTIVVSSHILTELEDYSTHVAIFEAGKLIRFEDLKKREAGLKATRILCRFTQGSSAPRDFLKRENIACAAVDPSSLEINAQLSSAQASELLKKLANADLGLYHFEHLQTRIEDTYLETFKKGASS